MCGYQSCVCVSIFTLSFNAECMNYKNLKIFCGFFFTWFSLANSNHTYYYYYYLMLSLFEFFFFLLFNRKFFHSCNSFVEQSISRFSLCVCIYKHCYYHPKKKFELNSISRRKKIWFYNLVIFYDFQNFARVKKNKWKWWWWLCISKLFVIIIIFWLRNCCYYYYNQNLISIKVFFSLNMFSIIVRMCLCLCVCVCVFDRMRMIMIMIMQESNENKIQI